MILLIVIFIVVLVWAISINNKAAKAANFDSVFNDFLGRKPVTKQTATVFGLDEQKMVPAVIKRFFSPAIKVLSVQEIQETEDEQPLVPDSPVYQYLANFFKRYGDDYPDESLRDLQRLLESKSFLFSEEQLKEQIDKVRWLEEKRKFKNAAKQAKCTDLDSTVLFFVKNYYEEIETVEAAASGSKDTPTGTLYFNEAGLIDMANTFSRRLCILLDYLRDIHAEILQPELLFEHIVRTREKWRLELFDQQLSNPLAKIEEINVMEGFAFEAFLKQLFERMGYEVIQTKSTGDQGADLVVSKMGERKVVQAKRFKSRVSNKAVQEAVSAVKFYSCSGAMVVTNGTFTKSAEALAEANSVTLVDGDVLRDWLERFG